MVDKKVCWWCHNSTSFPYDFGEDDIVCPKCHWWNIPKAVTLSILIGLKRVWRNDKPF